MAILIKYSKTIILFAIIGKIKACIANAIIFNNIINTHGEFINYLKSFGDLNEGITLERLKDDLRKFDFLGPITAYHFMLDLGLKVWKPDRVIRRILKRLGLIDNLEDIGQAITVGREIADQVGLPIRYIDIVFVKYGQMGEEESFGLPTGICLEKNPRCSICEVQEFCTFT
jgi:DNA-3-methyladenine glycosylase I